MASLDNSVFDSALGIIDNATTLTICSSEPANFAAISGVALGTATPSFTGPVDGDTSGRKITIDAVSNGSVSGTGTASHWAIDDGATLLASGSLDSPQSVTNGNIFTLTAIDIEVRDPS